MTVTSGADRSSDVLRSQLQPVRRALLDSARAQAAQLLEEASSDAAAIVDGATTAADDEVRRAEERAGASARARSAQRLDRARAEAHGRILRTRTAIHDRLVATTRRAVLDLRADPRYPALLDHFEQVARRQLGADAVIERDPDGVGGIVAHQGDRRVDYSLAALADRALDTLGDDIERLWT